MTNNELYELIKVPEGAVEQLKQYESQRQGDIPSEIKDKLFHRESWDAGVKELRVYQGTQDASGNYKYNWAWWLQRQITLQEFRIGSLEYEFVESNGHREIEVHIPSDADMSMKGLTQSVIDFLDFVKGYMPDWSGVAITTFTWMIMPELEELLPENSKILAFKSLFDIDSVDYEQNWYMGWIFPGYAKIDENLPEKTTLHRNLKAHLLAGKKFGIAKGHLMLDRVKSIYAGE